MEDLFNSDQVVGIIRRPDIVVGDDDSGNRTGLVKRPTFCVGSTPDEIQRAHDGDESVFQYDIARQLEPGQRIPNPGDWQCETARLYDLRTDRWYREDPYSLGKNLGAGIINSIIPGSDLGDAGSSTQILGQSIGSVAGLFVNPGQVAKQAISKITNSMSLGTTLTGAFNFVNKAFSGPIGTIATGYVGTLLNSPSVPAQVQSQIYSSGYPNQISEQPLTRIQSTIFPSGSGGTIKVGGSTVMVGDRPWYQNPWILAGGALALLTALFFVFRKRKRK